MKPLLIMVGVLGAMAFGVFIALGGAGFADYSTMTGAEVYQRLCASCHGSRGTAPTGAGNSYVRKRDYWTEESLLAYIANPRAVKAKMPHLRASKRVMNPIPRTVPTAARERLVAHVLQLMDALK